MGLMPDFHSGSYSVNGANGNGRTNGSEIAKGGEVTTFRGHPLDSGETELYKDYAAGVQQTLENMPWQKIHEMVGALVATWEAGAQVILLGNGGSASTATHLACDLSKNTAQPGLPRLRALALNDNMAAFSAYANDNGFDSVFAEQLLMAARPGDLVVAISTSGNSPNVLRAMEAAREMHLRTVGLCGYGGGRLAALVDVAVIAPNHCVEQIEDIHMVVAHTVTVAVRRAMQTALLRRAEFRQGVLEARRPAAAGQGRTSHALNGSDTGRSHAPAREVHSPAESNGAVSDASDALPWNGAHYWRIAPPPMSGHD